MSDQPRQTVVLVKAHAGHGQLRPGTKHETKHPTDQLRRTAIAAAYESLLEHHADERGEDWEPLRRENVDVAPKTVFSRFPLVLPHTQITRMVNGHQLLILSRQLDADAYEVHDEQVVRQNRRHERNAQHELRSDPAVFVIELTGVTETTIPDGLDLLTVRRSGVPTLEEFYRDWLRRRRELTIGLTVRLYEFEIAADALYLHQRPHRGYTRNPANAVPGEPQVIDRSLLDQYSTDARERYETAHAEEIAKQQARSLGNQLREARARAALRGVDVTPEVTEIQRQIDQIRSKAGAAA